MNEQNQHSREVNLEVASEQANKLIFRCYINPEGATAVSVTLLSGREILDRSFSYLLRSVPDGGLYI